jgi:hypothetical protein
MISLASKQPILNEELMAKRIEKVIGYSGGKEGLIAGLGTFFLTIGIIGAIAAFFTSGLVTKTEWYHDWGQDGLSISWVAFGSLSLIQGIIIFILLNAGAEIIRLLKKQNGLKYGGKISEAKPILELHCSNCDSRLPPSEADIKCIKCGEELDSTKKAR